MSGWLPRLAVIALLLILASPAEPRGGRNRRAWRRRRQRGCTSRWRNSSAGHALRVRERLTERQGACALH